MTTYNATQQLIKSYSDKTYKYTATVNHRGTVVAFAMDAQHRMHYAVLDMGRADAQKGELDVNYWPEDPKELRFPSEIEQVGYSIVGATAMPLVKKGGRLEAKPGALRPEEVDGFLSTTARLTADAPFQVFSDNKHIFVFRQSLPTDHADMVHKLQTGGASGDSARPQDEFVLHEAAKVPLVDNTLLCDRFILAGAKLQPKLEVRYRRSRHKTQSAGATDSLGAKDMEGRPFFEPTQELAFIKNLQQGRFSVLQLPTEVSSVKRWQIFSHNSVSDQIDSFNLEVSGDGLFNPAGTQLYTSPDPQYQNAVLEREPGNCPFTGLPLIPVVSNRGFAESCLSLDGKGYVKADIEVWNTEAFTLELWIKPESTNQDKWTGLFASMQGTDANSFQIDFDGEGSYRFSHTEKTVEIGAAKTDWQHLAVSHDGATLRTYLDGDASHTSDASLTTLFKTFILGLNRGGDRLFSGCIDEVRVWDYARSENDIQANKNRRLIGDEPGLKAYYRFDEGSGAHLSDQTGNGHIGTVQGEAAWVASDAPIGDHPSVRRSSFALVAEQTDPIEMAQSDQPPAAAKARVQAPVTLETTQESFTPKCLDFDGSDYIKAAGYKGIPGAGARTVEAWIKTTSNDRGIVSWGANIAGQKLDFRIQSQTGTSGAIRVEVHSGYIVGDTRVNDGKWHHVAYTFPGGSLNEINDITLFVDGQPETVSAKRSWSISTGSKTDVMIGKGITCKSWLGQIGEVRIWDKVRNSSEIQATMNRRLTGNEDGLVLYYTFDEGSGSVTTDQSGHGHQGTLQGSLRWEQAGITLEREVAAPEQDEEETEPPPPLMIDHSGSRALIGGLSARLYYQQEATATGYDGQSKPMKKNARVMLAAPTMAVDQPESAALATVDFAVSRQGCLAQVPDALTLPVLQRPKNAGDASAISQLEGTIRGLTQDIERLSDEIAVSRAALAGKGSLQTQKQNLETELSRLRTQLTNERKNPFNYWNRLQVKANDRYFAQDPNPGYESQIIQTQDTDRADEFKFERRYGHYFIHRRRGKHMWVYDHNKYLGLNDTHYITTKMFSVALLGDDYISLKGVINYEEDLPIAGLTDNHNIRKVSNPSTNYDKFRLIKTDPCNNTVSNLEDQLGNKEQTLTTVKTNLNRMLADEVLLRHKEADMIDKQNLLLNKKSELNLLSGGGQGEISLAMNRIHSDLAGLTVSGALLAFAKSEDAPLLYDSATGKLTTYYRSAEGQLLAGYLDVNVARARYEITHGSDQILFLARSAGSHLDEISITITSGKNAETCTLTIASPNLELTEVWQDLPRNPRDFAAIVNGQSEPPEDVTASVTPTTYSLAQGSTQLIVLPQGSGMIFDGTATRLIRGVNCQWIADAPGQAYYFDGDKHRLTTTAELNRFAPEANLTLESWANPSVANTSARLLHYNGQKSSYFLGLEQAQSQVGFAFDGNDWVSYPLPEDLVNFDHSFTLECWVYFVKMEDWKRVFHVSKDSSNFMQLLTNNSTNKLQLTIQQEGTVYQKASDFLPQLETWYHIACVWDAESQRCQLLIDGDEQTHNGFGNPTGVNQIGFAIGARVGGYDGMQGHVDEVRLWNYARSQEDIQLGQYRRAYSDETGLLAHYTFEDGEPLDRSGNGYHGITQGNPSQAAACVSLRRYHLVAGVSAGQGHNHEGQQILRSTTALEANHWSHLACTFAQSYALHFDGGNDYLDCGRGFVLDILDDLTLELFLQVPQVSRTHGLLSKGRLGQTNQSVPYQLALEPGGRLRFTFEDGDGKRHDYRSTQSLSAGSFHRIAVTRKKGMTQSEKKGTKSFEFTDADGKVQTQQLEMVESLDFEEWVDITFYIDGKAAGTSRYTGQAPSGHDGSLEIGRIALSGGKTAYTQGTISEVRLWRTARSASQIATAIEGGEQGLISWWQFEEQEGNVAVDSKGDSHGKIQGAQRVRNPDPVGSRLELSINGMPVSTQVVGDTWRQQGWGESQFSLGGALREGAGHELFNGMLEEVRIWRIVRTQEQLLDNLFGRLKGEKQDLIAYYTFDESSTASQADKLYDNGLGGCHMDLPDGDQKPAIMLSTAPISNDASIVRSALSGLETAFQSTVDSAPSVQEYGDMQRDRDGNTTGVMKRCYSYLRKGRWYLYTGYKVGDLVAEWIGQAQFDPQVIGYVEGVAPLPSENLTDGAMSSEYQNYAFVETLSNLELVESESVSYNVSSSTEGSIDASFDTGLSTEFHFTSSVLTAPFGFGVSTPIIEGDITVGANRHAEGEVGWANEQSFGTSINRSHSLSVALGGSWESPEQDKQLNPAVGRRLLPGNMGFALVQSETADIFAMRLAHNNALVSFRMQPNPDIPKDWNLIPFPINPRYVKQGTLDGRIGYDAQGSVVLDPDYPNAVGYGEYSYFKPREAYALKRRIQREEQQLRHYYEAIANETETNQANQSVSTVSGVAFQAMSSFDPSLGKAMEDLASSNHAESQPTELPEKFAKRNLVNTYVWTADGGLFAETTETSDIRTESTSSSFSLNSSATANIEADLKVFGVGFSLEFEASMGGGYSTSRTSDKESEKSFSVEVVVDPPGDLQLYQPKPEGGMQRIYDDDGNPVSAPGKVDAYRFMTFYMDSDKNNFEDLYNKVVDPVWLAESDHPNAIALRQANQAAKKPACWRVLHRVTFVSRLLPDFADPTEAPLPAAMKVENIDSNWQLIQKLEPFVRDKTGDTVAFGDAVRETLNRYLPELMPHSTEIIQYLKLYYGMTE